MDGRGRWHRWQRKDTTDDYLQLRLDFLRRRFGLSQPQITTITWHRGQQKTGEIGLTVQPGQGLMLRYNWRKTPVELFVPFAHTAQPGGGKRTWLQCPGCGRRCSVLYGGRLFLCRVCYRLPYPVQMAGNPTLTTIENKLYWLRRRLQATDTAITDGPPATRPHYMHWRTYERLCAAWQELLELRDYALTIDLFAVAGILREAYALDTGTPPFTQDDLTEDMQERWQAFKLGTPMEDNFSRKPHGRVGRR